MPEPRAGVSEEILRVLAERLPGEAARILDLGGGTGGLAVLLAQHGHLVTVVDPSPDSLAALDRRAAETGTREQVRGLQGDAGAVADLIPAGSVDLVLCHSVLEVVDDPVDALRSARTALRPDGLLSLVVANRVAAVAARAGAGRLAEARHLIADPAGRAGPHDPLARRFTVTGVQAVIADAGLVVLSLHGVRIFTDAVPAAVLDDANAAAQLTALESAAAADPAFLPLAARLHAVCAPAVGSR